MVVGSPAVVHLMSGPGGAERPVAVSTSAPGDDDIAITYALSVPAGGRVIVMHFAVQASTRAAAGSPSPSTGARPTPRRAAR